MAQKPKPDDAEQSERFIEAAKKAEADETEEGAESAFRKVVSAKRPSVGSKKVSKSS